MAGDPNAAPGPPVREKKRESTIGLVLTAAACALFLVWWFRPESGLPPAQTPGAYVTEAMKEPRGPQAADGWLIDLDLLEVAVLQAGGGLDELAVVTASQIRHPNIQARAFRQIAQKLLGSDAKIGLAPSVCDHISDPVLRTLMRDEVLIQLAQLDYTDTVIPQATTPRLKAALAATLAQSGQHQKAMELLAEAQTMAAAADAADMPAIRENLALTRVRLFMLKKEDLPAAIQALREVPAERQPDLWTDLFRTVFGAGGEGAEDSRQVLAAISDPVLRHRLELESVQSLHPLRAGSEFVQEAQARVSAASGPAGKAGALLELAETFVRVSPLTDATPELNQATAALKEARPHIDQTPDPAARVQLLAQLAEGQSEVTLAGEAAATLDEALKVLATVPDSPVKLELAAALAQQAFNTGLLEQAQAVHAARIAGDCMEAGVVPALPVVRSLVDFHIRAGNWSAAAQMVTRQPESLRTALLDEIAELAGDQVMGYDPSDPPPRGPELDRIRLLAITDEPQAAVSARLKPAGPDRARALLAVAKGRLLPPGLPPNIAPELLPDDETLPEPDEAQLPPETSAPDAPELPAAGPASGEGGN